MYFFSTISEESLGSFPVSVRFIAQESTFDLGLKLQSRTSEERFRFGVDMAFLVLGLSDEGIEFLIVIFFLVSALQR
jgi:hypothetical protein